MYILPFEFSISEPGVILTLGFQGFSDGLSGWPLVTLLVWGPHTQAQQGDSSILLGPWLIVKHTHTHTPLTLLQMRTTGKKFCLPVAVCLEGLSTVDSALGVELR